MKIERNMAYINQISINLLCQFLPLFHSTLTLHVYELVCGDALSISCLVLFRGGSLMFRISSHSPFFAAIDNNRRRRYISENEAVYGLIFYNQKPMLKIATHSPLLFSAWGVEENIFLMEALSPHCPMFYWIAIAKIART